MAGVDSHPSGLKSFELLSKEGDEPPKLKPSERKHLRRLAFLAFKHALLKAQIQVLEAKRDPIAKEIRQLMPHQLYGFWQRRKAGLLELIVTRPTSPKVKSNSDLIKHLGDHAGSVITEITLPIAVLYSNPANRLQFLRGLRRRFKREGFDRAKLKIDRAQLERLLKAEEIKPYENLFVREGQTPQVLTEIKPLED